MAVVAALLLVALGLLNWLIDRLAAMSNLAMLIAACVCLVGAVAYILLNLGGDEW